MEGGLQRELPDQLAPGLAEAQTLTKSLDWTVARQQLERWVPSAQVRVYDQLSTRLGDARADRIRGVADKTAARQQRREKTLASVMAASPARPRGMLAAFSRGAHEKQLAQWQGRAQAARSLVDEARELHWAMGRARLGRAVDAYARDRIEKLDPGFVKRVDGFKQEVIDRAMAERERVRQQERVNDRDRGKDRGQER